MYGQHELDKNWLEWEKNGDKQIIDNTTKNKYTFIGLGTDYKEEYNKLIVVIVFTDFEIISEVSTVKGTQNKFTLHCNSTPMPSRKWHIHTATILCSYLPCRTNPVNRDVCLYTACDITTKIMS